MGVKGFSKSFEIIQYVCQAPFPSFPRKMEEAPLPLRRLEALLFSAWQWVPCRALPSDRV